MRILLAICMLGFALFEFSACGNDDDRVALVRSEARTAMQKITNESWAGVNLMTPKAPKGKSWGEWMVEGAKVEFTIGPSEEKAAERFAKAKAAYLNKADRWTIFDNGYLAKGLR